MRLLPTLISFAILVWCGALAEETPPEDAPAVETAAPTPAPTANWPGCVDPNNPDAKIEIGQETLVCLLIGNQVNWAGGVSYTRVSFKPQADQYSRLYIPDSFGDLVLRANTESSIFTGRNITVSANAQDKLSFLRLYYDFKSSKIYPYLTAIIEVDGGVVKGITWDDACIFCGGGECDEITYNFNGIKQDQSSSGQPTAGCFQTEENCNTLEAQEERNQVPEGTDVTICNLALQVVWSGTDKNGIAFQSSAYRFSQFPAQEFENRFTIDAPSLAGFGGGQDKERQLMQQKYTPVDVFPTDL